MISYAANGRISGVWIVRRLLSQKLICAGERDITYDAGKRTIRGLQFSEELKSDLDIMEDFRTVARNVLTLYFFAEGQEYLRVPVADVAPSYHETLHFEDISGISLLQMVSDQHIRIWFDDEETEVYAERGFLMAVPDAEELLRDFVRMIFLFGSETGPSRILVREKQEIDTRELSPDLTISYGPDSLSMGGSGSELAYLYIEDEDSPGDAESLVTEEVESTLLRLHQMMQDIDDASDSANQDSSRFGLSFDEGKSILFGDSYAAVPDGFLVSVDLSGKECRMWLPNPENPEEWEASLFSVQLSEDSESCGKEALSTESREGQSFRVERVVQNQDHGLHAVIRMIGVPDDVLEKARGAAETLLQNISFGENRTEA